MDRASSKRDLQRTAPACGRQALVESDDRAGDVAREAASVGTVEREVRIAKTAPPQLIVHAGCFAEPRPRFRRVVAEFQSRFELVCRERDEVARWKVA